MSAALKLQLQPPTPRTGESLQHAGSQIRKIGMQKPPCTFTVFYELTRARYGRLSGNNLDWNLGCACLHLKGKLGDGDADGTVLD